MNNMRIHKISCICCRGEIPREARKCLTRLLLIPVLAVEIHASAQERQMNAADMECSKPTEGYGQAVLGADFETGTFHRAQDADTKTGIFFNADAGGKIPSQGGLSFQAILRKRRALRLDIQPVEGYAVCDCRQYGRKLAKAGILNVDGHIYPNRARLFERGPRNGSRCRAGSEEGRSAPTGRDVQN